MLSSKEAAVQRMLTKQFIAADAESVALQPFRRESNGSGGYVLSPQPPRLPQNLRLIPVTNFTSERNTLDGKSVVPQFVLMGEYDANITRGDRFELNGKRYEVVHVQEDRDYQTKGETVLLGDV